MTLYHARFARTHDIYDVYHALDKFWCNDTTTRMGNVVSPAKIPKVTKLKQIVHILVEQQRKIKRSKQEAMRRQRQVHIKMKNSMSRKTEKRWTDVGIDDDIREMAEEIAYQRNRVLDLKVCVDTLRNLQYKVQSILNAYYTHTTLMIVNNAIKQTNIMVEKLDKDQGKLVSNEYTNRNT